MVDWKRFTHGDCPVCSGARKDCRENTTTRLIHCRHTEANPIDYVFRGPDLLGFGMWAYKPDVEAFKNEKLQKWIEQQRIKREFEEKQLLEQKRASLTNIERDREIRKILDQLTLTESDRTSLNKRGLSDKKIDEQGYRSVKQWQKLDFPVNDSLAGVRLGGYSLLTQGDGILCPIKNHERLYVGWQLRLTHTSDSNRYLWAAGERKRKVKARSHLKENGELPLSVFRTEKPSMEDFGTFFGKLCLENLALPLVSLVYLQKRDFASKRGVVGLAEGTSFKPHIASNRLKIPFIGASGGHHSSSPISLKASLEEFVASTVILYPDAGAVLNTSVLASYRKTIDLLKRWGYPVKVAWWGQVDKADGDIDEIDSETIATITYLTPDEFVELAKKEQYHSKVIQAQKKLNKLTYQVNLLLNCQYLPNLIGKIPEKGIVSLGSYKGSGKSTQIKKIIAHWRKQGKNVISITPRIALGREQAVKWEIEWIEDSQGITDGKHKVRRSTIIENQSTIGLCWDSLLKLLYRDWSNTLVVIDECELGLAHLATSSTIKEKRSFIFKLLQDKFFECTENGGMVLVSDGDLSNISIDYFKALCPDADVFTIVNEHKPQRWEVDFYSGKRDQIIEEILDYLGWDFGGDNCDRPFNIAVPTDNQQEAKALEQLILERYPDISIIRIDSEATEQDWGKEFVKHPNESIERLKPRVLIYTPSLGVGVSIDVKWFDRVYGLFFGQIEPSQCRQMLARVRQPVPRIVWAADSNNNLPGCRSFLPEVIKKQQFKFHSQTTNIIDLASSIAGENADDRAVMAVLRDMFDEKTGTWDNPHIDLYAKIKARRNFGLSQLAVQLRQELIDEGHSLTLIAGNDSSDGEAIYELKQEIKQKESVAIANAPTVTLEQAQNIKASPSSTKEERQAATLAFLKHELPGLPIDGNFIYKWILEDGRRLLNQVKLYWMFLNPEKTAQLDRKEWQYKLKQFTKGVPFLPDIKTHSLQVKVIKDLGLFDLIDINNLDKEYCQEDKEVLEFLARAKFMRHKIFTAFNLTITDKTYPISSIDRLLQRVGMGLKLSRTEKVDGKKIRYYKLAILDRLDARQGILEALDRKYQDLEVWIKEQHTTPNTTDNLPCKTADDDSQQEKIIEIDESAQTQTSQEISRGQNSHNTIYNQEFCPPATPHDPSENIPSADNTSEPDLDFQVNSQQSQNIEKPEIGETRTEQGISRGQNSSNTIYNQEFCPQEKSQTTKAPTHPVTKDSPIEIFEGYPHRDSLDPRAQRNEAIAIKNQILECGSSEELLRFRSDSKYSDKQINWVWWNILTRAEKARVEGIAKTKQLELDFSQEFNPAKLELPSFSVLMHGINWEIKRVGGTVEYWRQYIIDKYGKRSRHLMEDEQLFEFWGYLKSM